MPAASPKRSQHSSPTSAPLVKTRRPKLSVVEGSQLEARPQPSTRLKVLFGLLGISILFLIGVHIYVSRLDAARAVEVQAIADLTGMTVMTPTRHVYPRELRLSWEPVNGATSYLVRVRSAEGAPVVDPVEVMGTTWYPPNAVIPGLVPGSYVWTVEGIDSSGIALARSQPESFTIRSTAGR